MKLAKNKQLALVVNDELVFNLEGMNKAIANARVTIKSHPGVTL